MGDRGLSLTEQRSQVSAWALVAAPLLISADLAGGLDNETLALLAAPEVVAVSQDALAVQVRERGGGGRLSASRPPIPPPPLQPHWQGTRVSPASPSGTECWARPLSGGAVAAVLLNRGEGPADVSCTWAELGLPAGAKAAVRDLWARADLGDFTGAFTARGVESHGAVMVRVTML